MCLNKPNSDVRKAIDESGFRYWEVADRYGCTDTTFSKKLRKELPNEVKSKIFAIIEELKAGGGINATIA